MTEHDPELAARALAWRKRHDGGTLVAKGHSDGTDLAIAWDNGGDDEFAAVYDGFDFDDAELIAELVNWALETLAPSRQETYLSPRVYLADES